ncbi:hypothetical protein ABXW19_11855, partial [Streptococcus suis]|uniref:hypothetical protein n=1 Tax=Streptococcus suis TaxID=1307 RepID=UPI003CF85FED
VLFSDDLEAAIRGSDTFATSKVLRSSPLTALLDRRAVWRNKPASESQRALIERRLGFTKANKKGEAGPSLTNLTRG